jgi:hypothetical protein
MKNEAYTCNLSILYNLKTCFPHVTNLPVFQNAALKNAYPVQPLPRLFDKLSKISQVD